MNKRVVFIYGKGKYGKAVYDSIKVVGGEIEGVIDSFANDGDMCEGRPVYRIAIIRHHPISDVLVIPGIKDSTVCEKIRFQLYDMGIMNRQIISGAEFIENYDTIRVRKYCLICGKYVDDFYPDGIKGEVFEHNHIVGGGYNTKCTCVFCKSIDRYRWMYYVLRKIHY